MEEARWGAVLQAVNGCAAQHSGQVLPFEGKTCSLGGSGSLVVIQTACSLRIHRSFYIKKRLL
jgi:hypothetical protein